MQVFQKQFTTKQIVFVAIATFLAIVVILVAFGVLPGRRIQPDIRTLEVWGVDSERTWLNTIRNFQSVYTDVAIAYRGIDENSYEEELINALAAGQGPDVFMFENNWILKHGEKIVPVASDKFSIETLQTLFPQVVEQDFVASNRIFALPLFIDTLALAYNRDLLDQGGVVFPPKTWQDVAEQTEKLKVVNEEGELERAAFALGGSSESVPNSKYILHAMLAQNDVELLSENLNRVVLSKRDGRNVFEYYLSFANPNSERYSWDESSRSAHEAFARSEVAGIFVFERQLRNIRARNAYLDIEVSPLPQFDEDNAVNAPNYWGLAVSVESAQRDLAWDFVIFAATNQRTADDYATITQSPPALRTLIDAYKDDVNLGVFANQALTARSEYQPSDEGLQEAFDGAILSVLNLELTAAQAWSRAADVVGDLLR